MNAVRATQAASGASDRSANALERLASLLAQGDRTLAKTCVSGAVMEIATTHYRVAGCRGSCGSNACGSMSAIARKSAKSYGSKTSPP
jgi:hypothetical protein